MSEPIKNRYEFTVLFEVENGNPNGDPDAGNAPRIDAETGLGIVTDVCIKRKIRNYVDFKMNDAQGYKIYVRDSIPLDTNRKWAYEQSDIEVPKDKKGNPSSAEPAKEDFIKIKNFMCENFFDIRAFGAVMTLTYNCGQVRGPVQLGFAKSIDVIFPQELSITSCTYANEGEKKSKMGRKNIVPYGLYRLDGYISANFANPKYPAGTGFSEDDVALLWEAIINMFETDHAAARGKMSVRELVVFKHESELGNCPAYKLFDLVKVQKKSNVSYSRAYSDYIVTVDDTSVPSGITVTRMI
jgi:CRISPR-associated protein Csd2